MSRFSFLVILGCSALAGKSLLHSATPIADPFAPPARGFISERPGKGWEQSLLTGNGTMGALVTGNPYDETLYLSHAALFLPNPVNARYVEMASRLEAIRKLCLEGKYAAAAEQMNAARAETSYNDERDPFIAACALRIKQPEGYSTHYQRAVNFMTSAASVAVQDEKGTFLREVFVSRPDDVIAARISGDGKQTAELFFEALPAATEKEKQIIAAGIKTAGSGVRNGLLNYHTLYANTNPFNPCIGYEVVGKVVTTGGERTETATGIQVSGAEETVILIKIVPILKGGDETQSFDAARKSLDACSPDYAALLAAQAKVQGELMGRASLSLDAPAAERAKSTERLNEDSKLQDAPLAKIERAFDAGRYNIICSTGYNPPNLQGLWSGTWLAPWSGSFTTNGNLPCAVSFLLMGNTPELMQSYFHYYDERMAGFREDARVFLGTRGFHVPPQLTVSPRETNYNPAHPHNYWHAGAAWAAQYYYDYYLCTGDRKFLEERAYPLMKEAAVFYEDFLTVTDSAGKVAFVPSYSPENAPLPGKVPLAINATMDFAAARQLLRHATEAAKLLGRDGDLQEKWTRLIDRMPAYEIGPDGSFREWLWPGLEENNAHRHASQLYALYDEMPPEIVGDPKLVAAVEHTVRERLNFQEKTGVMAFGVVQLGLAATHVRNAGLAQEIINFLAKGYWSSGMASFHNRGALFNMDISGGFPYLCASTLVYSEPNRVRFFPARPAQWSKGSLRGVRLRGGIVVRELTWDGLTAHAVLVSDCDQSVSIEVPGKALANCDLIAGKEVSLDLSPIAR